MRLLATGQLNTYDVLASEHIVFTEAALSAFTGQPGSARTAEASKPEAESAGTDTGEPKAPRRPTTPKEGEEQ